MWRWASAGVRNGASWALRPRELGQAVFWAGSGEKEREEEADRAAGSREKKWAAGKEERGEEAGPDWAWVWFGCWVSFLFLLFYFLIQTNSNQTNYLNSNFEFEFNPNTQTK